jgi:hypothetical protein
MINIKTKISFDEYSAIVDKVVNDCFINDMYSPANYELSIRTALLCAFAPEFNLSDCKDNNALWERVCNDEAESILSDIYDTDTYSYLLDAIYNAIGYRKSLITSGGMSMSDIALSKLFDVIVEKVEKIDTSIFDKETIESMTKAIKKTKDGNFEENLVDVMLDKGLLAKPNRQTRRKNSNINKSSTTSKEAK